MRRYVGVIVAAATGLALVTMSPGVANAAQVKCEDPSGVVLLGTLSTKKLPNGQYRIVPSPVKGSTYEATIGSIEDTAEVDMDLFVDGSGNVVRVVATFANGGRLVWSKPILDSSGFFLGWGRSVYTGPKPKAVTVFLYGLNTTDDSEPLSCSARVVVK